jgi:hypothetical protein
MGGVKASAFVFVDIVVVVIVDDDDDDDDDNADEPSSWVLIVILPPSREGVGDIKGGADDEEGASDICLRRIIFVLLT